MDASPAIIARVHLDALIEALRERGYTVIGPTVRSQSLVYDELRGAADLPAGWVDEQEGGRSGCGAPRTMRSSPTPSATTRSSASSFRRT